jgi:hypothetical protein
MNISPNQKIPVSYTVLPTDTTTYYVQSVLRDTSTGKILQTINLTQDATYPYRYAGAFNAVADVSGLGRYVDVTTIPYTDTAHTLPSQNYAALLVNYFVLQALLPNVGVGGSGSDIDYDKLALIISEKLKGSTEEVKDTIKGTKRDRFQYKRIEDHVSGQVSSARGAVVDALANHSTSMTGLMSQTKDEVNRMTQASISSVLEKLDSIEYTLTQVDAHGASGMGALGEVISSVVAEAKNEIKKMSVDHSKKLNDNFTRSVGDLRDHMDKNLSGKEVKLTLNMSPDNSKDRKESEKPAMDVSHLMAH